MKWPSKLVGILLFAAVVMASAKHPSMQKKNPPESWVDPATGLMWAGKDNGRDISWRKAKKYCRDLRLGGYSDWRLGTIDELEGIYDKTANARSKGGLALHVKGNLFLSGRQWSSTQVLRDDGRPTGLVWFLDFWNKYKDKDDGSLLFGSIQNRRALCVRSAGK